MIVVRAATVEEWQVLRDIRLEALRDAPTAFGSTYSKQAAYIEADWRRRISRGATFFAFASGHDPATPDGLVGGFRRNQRRWSSSRCGSGRTHAVWVSAMRSWPPSSTGPVR